VRTGLRLEKDMRAIGAAVRQLVKAERQVTIGEATSRIRST
jgi:hypothetical protein